MARNKGLPEVKELFNEFRQEIINEVRQVERDVSGTYEVVLNIDPQIRINRSELEKQLNAAKATFNKAAKTIEDAINKPIDKRSLFKGDDKNLDQLVAYRDNLLKTIKQLSTIKDQAIVGIDADPKQVQKLTQALKNYADTMSKIRSVYEGKGSRYMLRPDDIDLTKTFQGYKANSGYEINTKAIQKGLVQFLEKSLQPAVDAAQAAYDEVDEQFKQQLSLKTTELKGGNLKQAKETLKRKQEDRDKAAEEISRLRNEIEKSINDEIQSFISLSSIDLGDVSDSEYNKITKEIDEKVSNIKRAIEIISDAKKKLDLNIPALAEVFKYRGNDLKDEDLDNLQDAIKSGKQLREYIRTYLPYGESNAPSNDYLSKELSEFEAAKKAKSQAEASVQQANAIIERWVEYFNTIFESEEGKQLIDAKVVQALDNKLKDLNAERDALKADITELQKSLEQEKAERSSYQGLYEEMIKNNEELESEIQRLDEALKEVTGPQDNTTLLNAIGTLEDRVKELETNKADLEKQLADTSLDRDSYKDLNSKLSESHDNLQREYDELKNNLEGTVESYEQAIMSLNSQIEFLRSRIQEIEGERKTVGSNGQSGPIGIQSEAISDYTAFSDVLNTAAEDIVQAGRAVSETSDHVKTDVGALGQAAQAATKALSGLKVESEGAASSSQRGRGRGRGFTKADDSWMDNIKEKPIMAKPFNAHGMLISEDELKAYVHQQYDVVNQIADRTRTFHEIVGPLTSQLAREWNGGADAITLVNLIKEDLELAQDIKQRVKELKLLNQGTQEYSDAEAELIQQQQKQESVKASITHSLSLNETKYAELVSQIRTWYEQIVEYETILNNILDEVDNARAQYKQFGGSVQRIPSGADLLSFYHRRVDPLSEAYLRQQAVNTAGRVDSNRRSIQKENAKAELAAERAEQKELAAEAKRVAAEANQALKDYISAANYIVSTQRETTLLNQKILNGKAGVEDRERYYTLVQSRSSAFDALGRNAQAVGTNVMAEQQGRMSDAIREANAAAKDYTNTLRATAKAEAEAVKTAETKKAEAEARKQQTAVDKSAMEAQKLANSSYLKLREYELRKGNGEALTLEELKLMGSLRKEVKTQEDVVNKAKISDETLEEINKLLDQRKRQEAELVARYSSKSAKQRIKEEQQAERKAAQESKREVARENVRARKASGIIKRNYEPTKRLEQKMAQDGTLSEADQKYYNQLVQSTATAQKILEGTKADLAVINELEQDRLTNQTKINSKLAEELRLQDENKEKQQTTAREKLGKYFEDLETARLNMLRAQERLQYDNSQGAQAAYKKARDAVVDLQAEIAITADKANISEEEVQRYFQSYSDGAQKASATVRAEFANMRQSMGESLGKGFNGEASIRNALSKYVSDQGGTGFGDFKYLGINEKGIAQYVAAFKDADGQVQRLRASLTDVNSELFVTVEEGRHVKNAFEDFFGGIGARLKHFAQYIASFGSMYQIINVLRQGITAVRELDSAFVELKRISNDSAAALESFRKESFTLADSVGTTASTIINTAAEWEHLGYSVKEAGELAKTSAVYKNIADGMTSDSEATEDLVSIMKAYKYEAKDAMDITDALIATSNNYAVTAADVGNILKRSSAALAMANNSFEQTVAMGTAMSEVLQSAEVAGSSLKVLALRLRSSKVELEEMGEDVDDLVTSTPKLDSKIKALTNGFSILDKNGDIKSTYDIMKGIATVWNDMSDVNQAALLELIAGKTRAQGVSALLSNWSQVDEVLKTIAEDEGTALRNNEAKINTIEGRITRLKNAGQELAADVFDTETIKEFIKLATEAIRLLDKAVKTFGAFPTLAGGLGALSTVRGGGQPNQGFKSYKAPGIVRGNTKQAA